MATGPEHYLEAERMRAAADEWMDADLGWKANLTAQERINQRLADLADAQVHATLALAAATALGACNGGMYDLDFEEWDRVAGVQDDDENDVAAESRERAEEQAGREIDAAVESTGHLPGHYDAGPHRGRPICEGCPDCIGYTDPDEPDEPDDDADVAADGDLTAAMARHSSVHGTAVIYDPADPHDAALAEQARVATSTYFAAFDAEAHTEANAANHYADEHYNAPDDEDDDEPVDGVL